MEREGMEFDVLIVGGGPAGLAASIRIKQLRPETTVCLIEKGAEVGSHILSGAIFDPRSLEELFPDWQALDAPLDTPVREDRFAFLTRAGSFTLPHLLLPECFRNDGNYVISLGELCRWLGRQAEGLGIEIYPGFAGADVLDEDNRVQGVVTGDTGIGRDGRPTDAYQPGMELRAKYTLFAEGCRGHLGKQLEAKFDLRRHADPPVYALGIKELWEIPAELHAPGLVMHTAGWPLDAHTYGGSFMYHHGDNRVSIGFVVGLGYRNPYLSPFEEFQRYKTHPAIRIFLEGGRRIGYGARALVAGGLQSMPRLTFPGGALIGDDAGFLNAARIKGSHAAMKSGMLAAEAVAEALAGSRRHDELAAYEEKFRRSWLHEELHRARNFKPLMSKGLWLGSLLFGIDQKLLGGNAPWTLHLSSDHDRLARASASQPIEYPKPDGQLSFDRLSSVYLSGTHHAEDQPCHLRLRKPEAAIEVNLALYDAPEQRYCPAGVYEVVRDEAGTPRLHINAQNCLHCKACDIKDPTQNIVWMPPQGGEGPLYQSM